MAACGTTSTSQVRAMDMLANRITFCCPKEKDNYNTKAIIYVNDSSNYSDKFT